MKASSNIHSVSYDPASQELTVRFHSGQAYTYSHVTPEEFHAFDNAESPGQHFHKHVRSKTFKKIMEKER